MTDFEKELERLAADRKSREKPARVYINKQTGEVVEIEEPISGDEILAEIKRIPTKTGYETEEKTRNNGGNIGPG